MNEYSKLVQIRWSDLDPNFHIRHSVYYDWGALCRVEFLSEHELTTAVMQALKVGPVLFREECVFRKEVRSGDVVTINLTLLKAKRDFSCWSVQHQIFKNGNTLCAVITVDGAWLNVSERKLAEPPRQVADVFSAMPRNTAFEWIDK